MKKNGSHLLALVSMLALLYPEFGRSQTYSWNASGLDGAGTQNCVAIQPSGSGVILSASDVSGIQRSVDSGVTWNGANGGTPTGGPGNVAVVCWTNSTAHPDTAYAGDTDGFLTSTNAGLTWSRLNSSLVFAGNGGSVRWPRSTGNLIACDQSSSWPGYLYAGSVNGTGGEVERSTDGGTTWTTIFTSSDYIRGLAMNPSNPSVLMVATYGNNVWSTSAAKTVGTGGWTHLTNSPNQPEELLILSDGTAFAAGFDTSTNAGVVWHSASPYTTWTHSASSLLTSSSTSFLGIAGYGTGSSAVIYVTATGAAADGSSHASIQKSTNGGANWTDITSSANGNVLNQTGGAGGPPWWQMEANAAPYYELGAGSGDMANIQIDPANHDLVLASGRAGIWGTTNATSGAGSIRWYPMVAGLSVTGSYFGAIDPSNPGRVYSADGDWKTVYSVDYGKTFQYNPPPDTWGTVGRMVCVDPNNSHVYIITGDTSSAEGTVWSNPDPTAIPQNPWVDEGLDQPNKGRGLGIGRDGSGNTIILGVVTGTGLWRGVNNGTPGHTTWTNVAPSITSDGSNNVQFAWNQASKYVFGYAQPTGLWRSSDYGATWTKVWATSSSTVHTGSVAEDPSVEGRVYVSCDTGVFRFNDARTGSSLTPSATLGGPGAGGPGLPGAMTLANGKLYCCNVYGPTHGAGALYQWLSPATSTTSSAISDPATYPGQSQWPWAVAVDTSGVIYLADDHEGIMVGSLFADDFSLGSGDWTADTGTWAIVSKNGGYSYEQQNPSGGIAHVNVSGSSSWQNYAVSADITPLTFTTGSVGVSLYFTDTNDRYIAQITPTGACTIKLDQTGTQTSLATGTTSIASAYTVKLSVNNTTKTLTMFVDGTQVAQYVDGSALTFTGGTVSLNTFNSSADFANVRVAQP